MYFMKTLKIVLLGLAMSLSAVVVCAQSAQSTAPVTANRVGFTVHEFAVGGGLYNDGYHNRPVYAASYLLGRHFDERWFGGISAVCTYNSYYAGYMYYGERIYDETFALRILLNGRYHLRKERFSPYLGVEFGPAYIPGYAKTMMPYGGCQVGARWLLKTHRVLGLQLEPGVGANGYKEVLFKLTYEFI